MTEITLGVTGMTCSDCAHHVERALESVPGVERVEVAYPEAIARIGSETAIALETLNRALPKAYGLKSIPTDGLHREPPQTGSVLGKSPGAFGRLLKPRLGSEQSLSIAVIGTGGAAIAAAITAAERGAKVVAFGEDARPARIVAEQVVEFLAERRVGPCVAKRSLEFLARGHERLGHEAATEFAEATGRGGFLHDRH